MSWGGVAQRLNLPGLLFLLLLAGFWELLVDAGALSYEFLPAPSEIAAATQDLASSGELGRNVLHTLLVTLVGWAIAGLVGVSLGLLLGASRRTWVLSMASVEVLRSLPAVSFIPVLILIFGFSINMELIVIVFISQWPVLINTIDGVRSVTPTHRDLGRVLQLSRRDRFRKVVLPSAGPSIVVGLQLSLGLALALAIVAEMVGNPHGIGYALATQLNTLQSAKLFAYVIVTGVLGVILNAAFLGAVHAAFPGLRHLLDEQA
jgi:ABC-type nitrate/sulfonate/bicarbonate transport system permease component